MALVKDPNNIRLAILGMVEGNGHPFSWSAITNGRYDKDEMARCGYPVIPQYLGAEPPGALGIPGAKVTHVWCDNPADTPRVAKASFIANPVADPRDVIGQVDAVIIATDKGEEHVDRVRPFIEAGLPAFIDKPLADNEKDLQQFVAWHRQGKPFMSTSCMRYCKEFAGCRYRLGEVGDLRLIFMTMCKSWERYGIHALEGVYPFLAPGGWLSVTNSGTAQANIVHIQHASGVDVVLPVIADLYGGFGSLGVYGSKGMLAAKFQDTFFAFKSQLVGFIDYLRTGKPPVAFDETVEMVKIIIAGLRSRDEGGRKVKLEEIKI
jgi:predicted dehydrogenase